MKIRPDNDNPSHSLDIKVTEMYRINHHTTEASVSGLLTRSKSLLLCFSTLATPPSHLLTSQSASLGTFSILRLRWLYSSWAALPIALGGFDSG